MSHNFPTARRAGSLILTSSFDGLERSETDAPSTSDQCDQAYRRVVDAVETCGGSAASVLRLDHFTSSQEWLAQRQRVRAAWFGRPAPLASTGVAGRLAPGNALTVAAIAAVDPDTKKMAISGAAFGMPAIATAVWCGEYLFISGILVDSAAPFAVVARDAFAQLRDILGRCGLSTDALVRLDLYADGLEGFCTLADLAASELTRDAVAISGAAMPFTTGRLEITALACGTKSVLREQSGSVGLVLAGGLAWTGAVSAPQQASITGELDGCLAQIQVMLASGGLEFSALRRIEIALSDIADRVQVENLLAERLGFARPALVVWPGQGLRGVHLRIAAIADASRPR